jgi:hypothetical protein
MGYSGVPTVTQPREPTLISDHMSGIKFPPDEALNSVQAVR